MDTVSLPVKWRRARVSMSTVAVVAALGAATAIPASAAARADDGSERPPRPPVAEAVGFADGGFETPALPPGGFLEVGDGQPTNAIGPWNVIRGNVDIVTKEFWQTAEGNQSVDLSGDTAGTIEQIFTTVPGTVYTVSYALAGNPDGPPFLKRGHVEINGTDVQDFAFDAILTTHANMGYQTQTFTFVAFSQQTSLRFVSATVGPYGPVVDNVKVT